MTGSDVLKDVYQDLEELAQNLHKKADWPEVKKLKVKAKLEEAESKDDLWSGFEQKIERAF